MITKRIFPAIAVAAAFSAVPARAEADHDGQVWTSLTATTAVTREIDAVLELHSRYTDSASRGGQVLVRPSLAYKLSDGFALTGGYVYVRTRPLNGRANDEHRAWQQLGYVFARNDAGLAITGRTRLEQRFRSGADDTGWRLRQQVRAQLPVNARTPVRALVWNETFVGLNPTRWGARGGVDQVRTFVGVSLPVVENATVEPGYLNQTVFRVGPDGVNHIAAANLFVRF